MTPRLHDHPVATTPQITAALERCGVALRDALNALAVALIAGKVLAIAEAERAVDDASARCGEWGA